MASADADIWLIRGEGGDVTPMSPPFGEGIAQRLRTGALVRVNPDGSRWEAPAEVPASPPASLAEKRADEAKVEAAKVNLPMPALDASQTKWAEYAASTGLITPDAAADLEKDELIARFGEQSQDSPEVSEPAADLVPEVDGLDDAPANIRKPKTAQPKDVWVAWAVYVSDLSDAEAGALTKAELIERFG